MTVEATEKAEKATKIAEIIRSLRNRPWLSKHTIVNALADISEALGRFIAVDADDVIYVEVREGKMPELEVLLRPGVSIYVYYDYISDSYEIAVKSIHECKCSCEP